MAQVEYLASPDIKRYFFTQYPATGSSVSAFSTTFNADWTANLNGTVQALATTAAPLVAILIISGTVFVVNPGDWIGFNYGQWIVVANSRMSGLSYVASSV
jgi:hypothetical protein